MIKGKLIIGNPYDYNTVAKSARGFNDISLKRKEDKESLTPSIRKLVVDKDFVLVANFLGCTEKNDIYKYADKIRDCITWAINRTQSHDVSVVIDALKEKLNACPAMNSKQIDDLWVAVKLEDLRKEKPNFNETTGEKNE